MIDPFHQIGSSNLLKLHKTAFLCSRKIPASLVLKCYDWAVNKKESGNRVTTETASVRNKLMVDLADEICIGHVNPEGQLEKLLLSGGKTFSFIK